MLYAVYALLALTYPLLQKQTPFFLRILHKIAPILLLTFMIMQAKPTVSLPLYWGLIVAVCFSLGGDIALNFTDRYKLAFPIGLGLFLLAHIAYIFVFAQQLGSGASLSFIIVFFLLGYVAWLLQTLWPNLGSLRVPVLGYVVAILGMVITAVFHTPLSPLLISGALIFALSDSFIALDKFVDPLPLRDWLVMGTYYLAQFLIIFTFIGK